MRTIAIGAVIGAAVFAAIGLLALGVGLRNVARGVASRTWPTTTGVVLSADTEKSTTRDETTRQNSTTYATRTLVRYRVGTRDFETSTRRFGQMEGSGDVSDAVVERLRYPVDAEVSVSYDPTAPHIATLHAGTRVEALLLPFVGIAFLGAAVLALLSARGSGGVGGMITFFGVTFCVIGAALMFPGVLNLLRGRASTQWPITRGLIVFGTVPDADSTLDSRIAVGELEVAPSDQRLVFAYDVDGKRHFGNVRGFGQLTGASDEWASAIAGRFPLGSTASVSYSPSNPELAVLEPGISSETWYLPAAGLAFLLFGLAALKWAVPALDR